MEWRISLVGGFQVTEHGQARPVPLTLQRLVAYVALHEGWSARARVAEALWPELDGARSTANLRTGLWRLGRCAPLITAAQRSIGVAEGVAVDVRELAALAERVFAGAEPSLPEVSRFHGDLLPDWEDEWLHIERERLRQLQVHLLDAAASHYLEEDQIGQAVDLTHRALTLDPLREQSHRLLLRGYLAAGNRIAALTHYRSLATMLQRELGLPPEESTHALIAPLLPSDEPRSSRSGSRAKRRAPGTRVSHGTA